MSDDQTRVIEEVRVLWPHLRQSERMDWVDRLRGWFDGDFVATVKALAPSETQTEAPQ